jgi:hypothetical protein
MSISFTRKLTASMSRKPAPYISSANSRAVRRTQPTYASSVRGL